MNNINSLKRQKMCSLRALFALFLLANAAFAWAQPRTLQEARVIAQDFFESQGINAKNTAQKNPVRTVFVNNGLSEDNYSANLAPYYIFNNSDATAFVIISGDNRTRQILAYSTDTPFDQDNIAPGAAFMLSQYEACISNLDATPVKAKQNNASANIDFGNGKLLETALWGQDSPWWNACPVYQDQHTYVGCIATAMAILMRHYQWPPRGFGNKSYITYDLDLHLEANFEEFEYNWSDLPLGNEKDPDWNSENLDRIAKLMYQCGVASHMNYNVKESGTHSTNQMVGLIKYFGYTPGSIIQKSDVDSDDWFDFILSEINGNNPVLYSGKSDSGLSHAFVCDGYDKDGYLHFNFGWEGSSNGYYSIDTDLRYNDNQSIVYGVHPDYNAAVRDLPDFVMTLNPSGNTGLRILLDGSVHNKAYFMLEVNKLMNVRDARGFFKLAIALCDAQGQVKQYLGEKTDLFLSNDFHSNPYYDSIDIKGWLPDDYQISDGDYLMVFESTDDGETWKKVNCFDENLSRIKLSDVYDNNTLHLFMSKEEGRDYGLTIDDIQTINVGQDNFYLSANYLQYALSQQHKYDVIAYLCDAEGNIKFQIGNKTVSSDPGNYFKSLRLSCFIPEGSNVAVGDRIYIYSRIQDEQECFLIPCIDQNKSFIEITSDIDLPNHDENSIINVLDDIPDTYIYNLQGIKINNPTKGLYIINGKKVLIP